MVTPLYKVVEEHVRGQIEAGLLVPGDLLPSEPQLARDLSVSQGTVKKAIENLVHARLLYRHQGKGTYVSRIDFNNSLFRFFSYGDGDGRATRIEKETPLRRMSRAPAEVCGRLEVPEEAELLYIERVGFNEASPVLIEQSWWRSDLVGGLESESVHIPDLLYALVVDRFGIPIVRCDETLTAQAADEDVAGRLQIDPGDPVVLLKRCTYTVESRPIEYRETRGRADRFSYRTEIR